MSVDVDRDEINAAVLEWFDTHSPVGAAAASA